MEVEKGIRVTAGLPISETHTKVNLPTNQKGYDNSETTDKKLSARRIQIFRVPLSLTILTSYFLKTSTNMVPKRGTRQIWIRLVEYSGSKVSDPSEVPRISDKLMF